MVSDGRAVTSQDDWDLVWQEYDQRISGVAEPPASLPASVPLDPPAALRRRSHGALLALAFCLTLLPLPRQAPMVTGPAGGKSAAEVVAGLVSLAPEEAEAPPLAAAVSRLAAESAGAACWVMRLDPLRRGCPEAASQPASR